MLEIGFLIKKTIAFWLMPLSLVVLLLALSVFFLWKKPQAPTGKVLATISLVCLFVFSWNPISNALLRGIEQSNTPFDISVPVNYVVVLGNEVISDPSIPLSSHLSSSAIARLLEGLRILSANPHAQLIVTGYGGNNSKSSALVYKEMAVSLGIPANRIIMLDWPKDTEEEVQAVKQLVGNDVIAVATSASHMPRAIQFFNDENIKAIPAPTFYLAKYAQKTNWRFDAAGLLKTERSIYEYIGQLWQWLKN
jgi:uncharacterized SAM-binding protein YcdF (DUF218 family)